MSDSITEYKLEVGISREGVHGVVREKSSSTAFQNDEGQEDLKKKT